MPRTIGVASAIFLCTLGACGDDSDGAALTVPPNYSFTRDDASTVAYVGQTTRQVLVSDVIGLMRAISEDVIAGRNLGAYDSPEEIYDRFFALYAEGGSADPGRSVPRLLADQDTALQQTYADLGGANLRDKLAGNDDVTDHRDWDGDMDDDDATTNQPPAFVGWASANLVVDSVGNTGAVNTPEELVLALFWSFAHQASQAAIGSFPIDVVTPLYLTPDGHDLVQLTQKFLLGAVNFSQAADDYLDDDVQDKGLLAANELDEEAGYTTLEHFYDEAFGYWGAARDYGSYTDDELAASGGRPEYENGYFDTNSDGAIDFTSEYNFSASVNAAKRDRGSAEAAPTDFTADADVAWRTGRAVIAQAYDSGEALDVEALNAARDTVVLTWEKALAATAIHYINDVLADMDAIEAGGYSFADHAKHWGELKGFALSFQFNPRSPMPASDFQDLHDWIGDAPTGASPTNPVNDAPYRAALESARTLIGDVYGFEDENVLGW